MAVMEHKEWVHRAALEKLKARGVRLEDIAEIVMRMQGPYHEDLTMEYCLESVKKVLEKREIQHALLLGIELDELAEKRALSAPLQQLLETDEGLFGCDETLALGSVFGYGSIAITTFGHLDKEKIGIIEKLNCKDGRVNTFLDDLVAAVAASAAGRIAHRYLEETEKRKMVVANQAE